MSHSQNGFKSGSSTPKIALKGFSLSSKANPKAKPAPPSSLGKRPRATFAHDEDSDSDHGRHGKHESVTGFGEGGAIRREERKVEGPLVIPKLANRDWRGTKRGKNLLPPEVQAAQEAAEREARDRANGIVRKDVVDPAGDAEIAWGLTLTKRQKVETTEEQEVGEKATNLVTISTTMEGGYLQELKTVEQEALEALMGTRQEKKGPDLVIPVAADTEEYKGPVSETDAYKRAMAIAPNVSTLEDYERVPVEDFGAALLRGMGWKGEKRGEVRDVKRRQNLLGLGAKELKDAEELGAWVQKSDTKRLNQKPRGGGGSGGGERRPKASEYRREKEKRDERREERGGGGYRQERERERERERDRDGNRDRNRERDSHRDRDHHSRR